MAARDRRLRALNRRGVRSPPKNITLKKLRELRQDSFVNPDTGLELSEEESQVRIIELEEARAEREVRKRLRALSSRRTRSQGRPFIPPGQVIFRRIKGENVPFRKVAEPFL